MIERVVESEMYNWNKNQRINNRHERVWKMLLSGLRISFLPVVKSQLSVYILVNFRFT